MSRSDMVTGVPALIVRQWLDAWDKLIYEPKRHRKKPRPYFYLFTLPAEHLKALSGIQTRTTAGRRLGGIDLGIQRRHETDRSREIHDFVKHGYPWSDLSESKRKTGEFDNLKKPGWLPTAIVVNILEEKDRRGEITVAPGDLVRVVPRHDGTALVRLPETFKGASWKPKNDGLHPIEVIDGQHRLWAFEGSEFGSGFQLPVVAFHGLDISWQAYLFWTINVKPKRINASLAYDLYPLLRSEDWLEKAEEHFIYRETRAQELVNLLWQHPNSPWCARINMLGEPAAGRATVSQAAYVRSLVASFVKSWEGRRIQIGGLFGGRGDDLDKTLGWSRAQQAAFLIQAWTAMRDAVAATKDRWAREARSATSDAASLFDAKDDLAFFGPHSLFRTDIGVRGFLFVINDLCFLKSEELRFREWVASEEQQEEISAIDAALKDLKKRPAVSFLSAICEALSHFDWRTSSAPGLSESERTARLALRGSSGYKELRRQLLNHLSQNKGTASEAAKEARRILGYQ